MFSVTFKEINDIVFANLNIIIRMSKGRFVYKYPPFGEKKVCVLFPGVLYVSHATKTGIKRHFSSICISFMKNIFVCEII